MEKANSCSYCLLIDNLMDSCIELVIEWILVYRKN